MILPLTLATPGPCIKGEPLGKDTKATVSIFWALAFCLALTVGIVSQFQQCS